MQSHIVQRVSKVTVVQPLQVSLEGNILDVLKEARSRMAPGLNAVPAGKPASLINSAAGRISSPPRKERISLFTDEQGKRLRLIMPN
jgi:hypothetical protein